MTKPSTYFAPSALSRRIACPSSALLEADLRDVQYGPSNDAKMGGKIRAGGEKGRGHDSRKRR